MLLLSQFLHDSYYRLIKNPKLANISSTIQQGYLQLENYITNGNSIINYAVNKTDSNPVQRNSEVRLDQNDAFLAIATGFFLKNESSAEAGAGALQTYPNQTIFPAEANNLIPVDLEAYWNSFLKIQVGQTVYGQNYDLNPTRVVRTSQQSSGSNYSEKLGFDGYLQQTPAITFQGNEKNIVQQQIPTWAGQQIQYSTAGAGVTVYGVLKFYGFLIPQGSKLGRIDF